MRLRLHRGRLQRHTLRVPCPGQALELVLSLVRVRLRVTVRVRVRVRVEVGVRVGGGARPLSLFSAFAGKSVT